MELEDDAPALGGYVHFSANPLCPFTVFEWPICSATAETPAKHLLIRQRDDGQITLSISEQWNDWPDGY